jgi:hypothetical protein
MATQILPYEPSPSEKRKQWIAENVFGSMDNRYRANRLSQGIVDTIDMIPGYGDIEGIREGYHLATEGGSPYIGTGIAALGALPLVPGSVTRQGTDFLREQAAKLRVTPTQYTVEKTDPQTAAVAEDLERTIYSDRDGTEVPPAFESMASESPQIPTGGSNPQAWYNRTRAELATEGRPFTIETMAERSIVNNKDYQNPYKKYNVQGLIQSTLQSVDAPARANLERQFDEWIPQEMREGKATLQEVLDEIGRNKPRIHQQVDARPNTQLAQEEIDDGVQTNTTPFVDQMYVSPDRFLEAASYSRFMPAIPTDAPAFSSIDAARTLMPLKYTEKNLSVHSPKYGKLFEDPGHQEVGSAARPTDFKNTTNRIFTSRSGVYEIGGQRVLIPAEGQSGIYKMTKDEDIARRRMDAQIDPDDEADPVNIGEIRNRVLYNDLTVTEPHALSTEFLADIQPRLKEQFTLDDWKREVEDFRERSIDGQIETLYNRNLTPAGTTGESKQEILAANKKVLRERMNQYDDALNKLEYENGEAIHAAEVAYNTEVASMEGSSLPLQGARERYERELRGINDDFNADKEALDDQYANEREATIDLRLVQADMANLASNELHAMLNPLPSTPDKPTPLLKDWFPMHMKMSMNDAAVDPRIDAVRFPINDYAMQKQMGHETSPARLRMFSNEFDDMPDPDNPDIVGQTVNTVPRENAQKLGKIYEKETKDGINRIEAEYGIKLNGTVVEDDNLNQFLEIQMTPEIREAFQKVLMNKGGEVSNRPMMPLQYFNKGGQSKDALDRGVEAYEEAPIIAQIIAGETPAGFAADVASAAKYGRDAVRSVVAGQYGDALAPSIMSALSIVGLIPGIGALGTLGKKSAGQYLGKVRGSGDYGVQDTGHHAYRGIKLDPNIQGETAQYQDIARQVKEAEAQVPGGIENPQRSVTIPDPRSEGAQLSQSQGISGGGRYIQAAPHPDDVYIQGADGSVMLVNETTGTSRSIGIDGIPEGAPIRQPGGRMQIKDSTMPGGSRPLGGYARGGPVNRPLMNLRY